MAQCIAHRGASAYAPENTLAAFRKAKELGAQWVECDVQLTRDGEAVIFHDATLHRRTNHFGFVRCSTYKKLHSLDAGNGEKIPTLAALLACLDELSLSVHLEIKPCFGRVHKTTKKVMTILHESTLHNTKIRISSFSFRVLYAVRQLDKTIPLGMAMDHWRSSWQKHADNLSCVSVHCSKKILTPTRIREIKNSGREVLAYTVNDIQEAGTLNDMGVDAVFSDFPDLYKTGAI